MTLDFIVDVLVTILLLPLQLVLVPIDALLAQIPGIGMVPSAINAMLGFVGSIPSLIVSITGVAPFLWNALFIVFVMYITLAPGIAVIKKIWAWVRP
jgi:hypothetical protein